MNKRVKQEAYKRGIASHNHTHNPAKTQTKTILTDNGYQIIDVRK